MSNRSSIRFRVTAVAAALVAIVLLVASAALVVVQRQQLNDNLDTTLRQRAESLAALDRLDESLFDASSEDRGIQLIGADGGVIQASPNLAGEGAMADPVETSDAVLRTVDLPTIDDESFRVASILVSEGPRTGATLHLAESLERTRGAVSTLIGALAVVVPVAVVVLSGLVWWLVGRTLEPVEAIRNEVAHISGSALDRRVTVPQHDDEIGRLALTMNSMLDRLADASDRQRAFVADASHELRSPLTRIRTELEVDAAQPQRANLAATHDRVLEETLGMQRLVDDLLFLA
ncbi:MAG: histidine kinase dimerization/phospho-acceptor domain-containing protein, partial [Acidimicrobiales bacterium]